MTKWMKIAARNIMRNKRRSATTLLAIGVGFAAITLFYGYMSRMYDGLRMSAVQGEGLGHLTIYKKGWAEKGKLDPEHYMLSSDEIRKIIRLTEGEKEVVLATPQIQVNGLVSNGSVSTIFIAQGVVPKDDAAIKGTYGAFRPKAGDPLDDREPYGVEIAQDLAKYLGFIPGKDGVVMAATLGGQMNAMDVRVAGVYDSGSEATNDKYMRLTFDFAQSLFDTRMAEKIVVLLNDWRDTEKMRSLLDAKLRSAGINTEIRTWNELSLFYGKVRGMFGMIFLFIFCIVLVIVIMSTVNTMGMAVVERTREIGTFRALGLKRRGISLLFALEGALLGFLGSILGIALHTAVWALVRVHTPTYVPPGMSNPVPLAISFVPGVLIVLIFCLVLLSLVAAIIPARHAARQPVVDALGHV
jgi:putative ABC transport system permease protein